MSVRLPPIGFWSYATQDDKASDGKLTELRLLLSRELQAQYGREEVRVFQDVSAIPPGAQWEARIRTALGDSTFFIPLITPNFIQSEWCNKEFFLFREREKALKARFHGLSGESFIFPIYYVRIDGVEAFSDELLNELHRLQRLDFTRLRLKDYGSEAREKVAQLAESICRLLRPRWDEASGTEQPGPVQSKPTEVADLKAAAAEKAAEEAAARAAAETAAQEVAARAAARKPARGLPVVMLLTVGGAVAAVLLLIALLSGQKPQASLVGAANTNGSQPTPAASTAQAAPVQAPAPQSDPAASLVGSWSIAGLGCSKPITFAETANGLTQTFGGAPPVNVHALASPASGALAFRDDDGTRYELSGGKATITLVGASRPEAMTRCAG